MVYVLPEKESTFLLAEDNSMKKKIAKVIFSSILSLAFLGIIIFFEIKEWPVGSSISGLMLGFIIPYVFKCFQDLFDTTDWKVSQRKLQRGGIIKDQTIVRISFAYLYRIKIGNKYLLIKNDRGTGKYQPVGGVYKILGNEKLNLKNLYKVMDDDKIPIDESSRDDYRLRMENKHLRKFVKRFDQTNEREQIHNLGREFKEELVEKGIVNWNQISYRYCGRHMSELRFGEHFQCYELLLADIVELCPTTEQEEDLKRLVIQQSDTYHFATAHEIKALGINTDNGDLREIIADHSNKITQETEGMLLMLPEVGKTYTISL